MTRFPLLTGLASLFSFNVANAADPDLLVYDVSGFEESGFYEQYTKQHGVPPTFAFFGEEEEAFAKLMAGFAADVSHPCSNGVEKWRDAGLIEPWDISQIPSYSDVVVSYRTNPIFADKTGVYFIPADTGATAIAYNSDVVPAEDVASLSIFLNPKYAGRISLPDNVDDAYALAFLATGTSDWTTATQEDFERASAWMREAHKLNRAYWTDGAELGQLMASGEVLVSWAWNETPVTLSDEGHPIAFQREPVEGSSVWFCGYVNLVNGPGSEEKAHDFIEAWLSEDVTNYIVHEWGYGHSNARHMAAIDPATLGEVGLGPIDAPVLAQAPMDNRLREQMIREFVNIKAGF